MLNPLPGFASILLVLFFCGERHDVKANLNVWFSTEIIEQGLEAQRQQMLAEFEAERTNHQRVLRDYDRLEQRYQNLQDELEIEKFSPVVKKDFDGLISASSSGL